MPADTDDRTGAVAAAVNDLAPQVRAVVDTLPEALTLLALDGTVVHANGSAARLLGAPSPTAVRGRRLHDLVSSSPGHVDDLIRRWATTGSLRPGSVLVPDEEDDVLEVRGDGARLHDPPLLLVRLRPRDDALVGFSLVAGKVEEENLREARRRLEASMRELETVNRQLMSTNTELERYASVVSHDLRGPLATISGFAELLRSSDATAAMKDEDLKLLEGISRNAERMRDVIAALLELARVQAPSEDLAPVAAGEALDNAVDQLRAHIDERQGAVVRNGLPEVKVSLPHLTQLFQNLIANSLQYCAEDRAPRISVTSRVREGWAEIRVADNGMGVPEEERETIFELLSRGGLAEGAGTGIGLATCRRIVELYGGEISCVDGPGRGATFRFTLPAASRGQRAETSP